MSRFTRTAAVLLAIVAPGLTAAAQESGDPPPPPADESAQPLPSLDELLGLEEADEENAADDADDVDGTGAALDRVLDDETPLTDDFAQAVGLMRDSAGRLGGPGGTGVATQRMQEDIIRRLDILIDKAQQQQQQGSGSGSSSSQSQASRPQPNQGDQQSQQQPSNGQDPESASDGPPGQEARPGEATVNPATWGALPARLRDSLVQGASDRYSSLYRSMTEAYYRRLAEEATE
ncbi:MAG: hypothetical protein AAGF47_05440 [Planctomycetota bacterium]